MTRVVNNRKNLRFNIFFDFPKFQPQLLDLLFYVLPHSSLVDVNLLVLNGDRWANTFLLCRAPKLLCEVLIISSSSLLLLLGASPPLLAFGIAALKQLS